MPVSAILFVADRNEFAIGEAEYVEKLCKTQNAIAVFLLRGVGVLVYTHFSAPKGFGCSALGDLAKGPPRVLIWGSTLRASGVREYPTWTLVRLLFFKARLVHFISRFMSEFVL